MECPKPQPGHQVMPRALKGHKEKCACPAGLVSAKAIKADIQNSSSEYFKKNRLINFV